MQVTSLSLSLNTITNFLDLLMVTKDTSTLRKHVTLQLKAKRSQIKSGEVKSISGHSSKQGSVCYKISIPCKYNDFNPIRYV